MLAIYTNEKGEVLGQKFSKISETAPLGLGWIELALDSNPARIKSALAALQLEPTENPETKITRIGTRVMWTWGKENSLSFLKDEFLISDLLMGVGKEAEQTREFLVQEFSAASNGIRLPRIVRIKKGGQDVFQYELKSFKANVSVKEIAGASGYLTSDHAGVFKEWVELVR